MSNYKLKYLKYKSKYLLEKHKYFINNQLGGANLSSINEIINYYQKVPKSGIYNNNIKDFEKFVEYLIEKTMDNDEVKDIKKKINLEKKKLTNTSEYKDLIIKIKKRGEEYKKIGYDFEQLVFSKLIELIKEDIEISNSEIQVLKNPVLYISNDDSEVSDSWQTLGEIDAVIIKKIKNKKCIIAICEIKNNFDDIPDALFQIKRSFDAINSNKLVKLNNEILDDKYIFPENSSFLDISFVFTSSLNSEKEYFNIQSKLKHYLVNIVHSYSKLNYKKILKKIKKKQIYFDKLNEIEIKRYNSDIFETINLLKSNNLINRIKILN